MGRMKSFGRKIWKRKGVILAVALVLALVGIGYVYMVPFEPVSEKEGLVSPGNTRGDILYGVERTVEDFKLSDADGRRLVVLHTYYAEERLSEALALHREGRRDAALATADFYLDHVDAALAAAEESRNTSRMKTVVMETMRKHSRILSGMKVADTDLGSKLLSWSRGAFQQSARDKPRERLEFETEASNKTLNRVENLLQDGNMSDAASAILVYNDHLLRFQDVLADPQLRERDNVVNVSVKIANTMERHWDRLQALEGEGSDEFQANLQVVMSEARNVHRNAVNVILRHRDSLPQGVEQDMG